MSAADAVREVARAALADRGLDIVDVTVTIDGERRRVAAGDYARFKVGAGRIAVAATTIPPGTTPHR